MNFVCRALLHAVLLVPVLFTAVFGQSTAQNSASVNNTQAMQMAEMIVKMNNGWGENLNAIGAVLKIVETGRSNGRIAYRLRAEGLPADHVYSLLQWPVTQQQPAVALQGVTLDKSGIAICAGRPNTCGDAANPDDPIDLQTAPVLGEPVRLALVAQDNPKLRAAIKFVPLPNSNIENGCRIDAVLLTPHAELISVEASGFPPDTEATLDQDSEGEKHSARRKTDATGKLAWALMPAKAGLQHGSVTIQVKAPGCSPHLSVAWGKP